jgi:tetratricopeptide (TPR) repeat protein
LAASAAEQRYELTGTLAPPTPASIALFGATTPFENSTLASHAGRFRFRRLPAGTYTLAVFVPGRGEIRQTVEIGPGAADSRGRVALRVAVSDAPVVTEAIERQHLVSVRQLSIPPAAWQEFREAQKRLSQRDTAGAIARLERAVELAPQFGAAWNHLGTIAYQSQHFEPAADYFRKALEQEPDAYEPLVNLGGTLVTLRQWEEALPYNRQAVLRRPQDALANSQLGLNYFHLADLDRATHYLQEARRLDPAHFSHPQLTLAEIYRQRGDTKAAVAELEDFLRRHPDDPSAEQWRQALVRLRP